MKPTLVDLFCGAGGLSLGFMQAGYRPVLAADWDKYACETYRKNIGDHVHNIDLSKTTGRQLARLIGTGVTVDIVAGGPPCQGFSVQRRGAARDERNSLVNKFGELAVSIRPKAIVMENVPTVLGARGKEYVHKMVRQWEDAGYDVHSSILEAAAYGVPQMRRRAFIVAIRQDVGSTFIFPLPRFTPNAYRTVKQAIGDLPTPSLDFKEHPNFPNHKRVAVSKLNIERLSHVPEGGGRLDVPRRLQLPCHASSNGHRHLDVFGRLSWDKPAGTITAMFDNFTRGRFAHPSEDRNITSREGARLQSFPDDFVFAGPKKDVAKQIGNAVCPLVAQYMAEALSEALFSRRAIRNRLRQSALAL